MCIVCENEECFLLGWDQMNCDTWALFHYHLQFYFVEMFEKRYVRELLNEIIVAVGGEYKYWCLSLPFFLFNR